MAKQTKKTVTKTAETKPKAKAAEEKKPAAPKAAKASAKKAAAPAKAKKAAQTTSRTVTKKPAAPKAAAAPAKKVDHKQVITPEEHFRMVQDAAYYIAERNGFGGDDHRYWTEAEQVINEQYTIG